jgi:hypothetical protein
MSLVNWISNNYPSETALAIYKNLVNRSGYITDLYQLNLNKNLGDQLNSYYFPNLCMAPREVFTAMADEYDNLISKIANSSERNYLLAINKKRRALFIHKYQYDRGIPTDPISLDKLLQEAVDHFKLVDDKYLNESVSVTLYYNITGERKPKYTRRQLFIYPDYMDGVFTGTYHSDIFYNFIDKHKLYNELYKRTEDLELLHLWMAKALTIKTNEFYEISSNRYPLRDETLARIFSFSNTDPLGKNFDQNLLCLVIANRSFNKGDTTAGIKYYQHFDKTNFSASRDKYEYLEKTFFLNQLKNLCINLAMNGREKEAGELTEKFEKDNEKAMGYILMAEKINNDKTDPTAFVYLDSAFSKYKKVDFSQLLFGGGVDFRNSLIRLLSRIGGRKLDARSADLLSETIDNNKLDAVIDRVNGVAGEGNFYRATTAIPSTLTELGDMITRVYILFNASIKKESAKERETWKGLDRILMYDDYIRYQNF